MLYGFLLLLALASAQRGVPALRQIGQAPDGSMVVEGVFRSGNFNLRYKVSAPASQLALNGAPPAGGGNALGLNVLLHGDGGASFDAFPNADIATTSGGRLAGVVIQAPNQRRLWGGQSRGNGPRPQGDAHSRAVNQLIRTHLPTVLRFNPDDVWFTGVSGGAIMLSGFFLPAFLPDYKTGAMLLCGGTGPARNRAQTPGLREALATARIHWQATQNELDSLKTSIPRGIAFYNELSGGRGPQTVDATPTGTHCQFDNRGFNSGIQLVMNSWSRVMFGDGQVAGIGNVNRPARDAINPFRRRA